MTDVKHILRRFKNKKEKEKLQSEPPSTALPTPKVASKVPEVTETMPGDARPVHRTVTQAAVETAGEAMPATGDSPDSAQEKINRMNRLLKAAQKYVSDAPAKPAKEVGIDSAPPPAAGSVPCRIVQTEVMPSRENGPVHTIVTQIESPVVKTRVRPGRPVAAGRPIAAKPSPAPDVEVLSQNDAPCDRSYKTGVTAWEAPVSKPLPDATPGEIDGARCLNAALKEDTPPEPWMLEYLALSGGKQAADLIEKWCTEAACRCSALRAVGRLGNVQVIGTLLEALKNDEDETRAAAAEALERITGAGLKEEAAWEDWWNARHAELSPDCFYRYGEPFHFGRCIDEIACESTPALDRIAAHLELVIRGGAATPLNVDWPVERQKQAMGLLEEWWKENENRFTEGSWYFAGRSIV